MWNTKGMVFRGSWCETATLTRACSDTQGTSSLARTAVLSSARHPRASLFSGAFGGTGTKGVCLLAEGCAITELQPRSTMHQARPGQQHTAPPPTSPSNAPLFLAPRAPSCLAHQQQSREQKKRSLPDLRVLTQQYRAGKHPPVHVDAAGPRHRAPDHSANHLSCFCNAPLTPPAVLSCVHRRLCGVYLLCVPRVPRAEFAAWGGSVGS